MQVLDEKTMGLYIRARIEDVMNPLRLQYGFTTLEQMEGHLLELENLAKAAHLREIWAEVSAKIREVRDRRIEQIRRMH